MKLSSTLFCVCEKVLVWQTLSTGASRPFPDALCALYLYFLNTCTTNGPRYLLGPRRRPALDSTIACGFIELLYTRPHVQAALLCQVEEKRAKRELERAAKQQEDEEERVRVLRVLAEERAANRNR